MNYKDQNRNNETGLEIELISQTYKKSSCKELYVNNLDSLEKMNIFLETYNLPTQNHMRTHTHTEFALLQNSW